jgi:hypothetical protein
MKLQNAQMYLRHPCIPVRHGDTNPSHSALLAISLILAFLLSESFRLPSKKDGKNRGPAESAAIQFRLFVTRCHLKNKILIFIGKKLSAFISF